MKPPPGRVAAVEAWLREEFPNTEVATDGDFDREAQWFRVRTHGSKGEPPELVISYEAFEDHAVEQLVAALRRHRAAEHLRASPARPLMLDRFLRLRPAP